MAIQQLAKGGAQCVALCASLIAFAACTPQTLSLDARGALTGTIVEVIDGDTAIIQFGRSKETVRFLGVDTPETKHPTKPVECWGKEASLHTQQLLPKGTVVFVLRDEEARDRYGRFLAYVYRRSDNMFINNDLVAGGWAVPLSITPNTAFESVFAASAHSAQQTRMGLWGQCRR